MLHKPLSLEKQLLQYYFLNHKNRHYVRELARLLDVDPGNLQKKLVQLEGEGFFVSEQQGNQKYYFLNKGFPLYKEYQSLYRKKYGVDKSIAHALNLVPGVLEAYIFGSYAKGGFDAMSDIDLIVVGNHDSVKLTQTLKSLEKSLQRPINTIEYAPEDFLEKRKGDPFLTQIFNGKIVRVV